MRTFTDKEINEIKEQLKDLLKAVKPIIKSNRDVFFDVKDKVTAIGNKLSNED